MFAKKKQGTRVQIIKIPIGAEKWRTVVPTGGRRTDEDTCLRGVEVSR